MAAAAHAGFPDRLVTFNSGLESLSHTTLYQDFWSGELARLNWNPRGETANGLPWYSFTSWHADSRRRMVGEWFLTPEHAAEEWPPPAAEAVADHYRRFRKVGGTVTFNVLCYQDGSIYDTDFRVMQQVKRLLRG
jgi:hypothetical protein